ncbi:MAG TPA: nuclear transport factor 2 family protein [Ideonella sp.]|uniref:nuclear transport factor 2 family protein n=1 Tax=Ideonella sp. TaxID=1929293 RepID=UPI002E30B3DF|nr:nuclear transport factor 2 family protein [Ideonella sp.]HEX5686221.1 nuclear transport factor 2 family protein [Ideonella sp.]
MTHRLSHFIRAARAATLCLPLATFAATPAEDEVMAVTQAACDAFRLRDLSALDRLLAPEFTIVGPAGDVQPRSQAIDEVKAGDPQYQVLRNHDMVAHVYGDAATVQGITSLKGRSGGQDFEVDVRFTDTLVRFNGQWRLVVSHVTRLAKKP